MKKQYAVLSVMMALMLMSLAPAMAASFDRDATHWRISERASLGDVDSFFGQDITTMYRGKAYGRFSLQRGESGYGAAYFQYRTALGERGRFSLKWSNRGNMYGMSVVTDNDDVTVLSANARIIHNRQVTYGVPVTVTFHKTTGEYVITANNGDFSFSF